MPYKNPEDKKAADTRYAAANKDRCNETKRRWAAANREKVNAAREKWLQENPEKRRVAVRNYDATHPDVVIRKARKYYWNHVDKVRAAHRSWCEANPGICNALRAKRHAAKLQATPPWLTTEQLKQITQFYIEARRLFELDGVRRHVDHIYPLQGKTCSGLHVPWNLQILTKTENLKKRNKLPVSYMEAKC